MKFETKYDVERSIEKLVFEAYATGFLAGFKERGRWPNEAALEVVQALAQASAEKCFEMDDPR